MNTHKPIERQAKPIARTVTPRSRLLALARFDHATLEEAKKVFTGSSDWFAFDANGHLDIRHPESERLQKLEREKEIPGLEEEVCANLSTGRIQILKAVIAMLKQGIEAPTPAAVEQDFNAQVRLVAYAEKPNTAFGDFFTSLDSAYAHEARSELQAWGLEKCVRYLQDNLEQYNRVLQHGTKGMPTERQLREIDEPERSQIILDWDLQHLMTSSVRQAKFLRGQEDCMRFHNQFPEAVNFIRASKEAEFLLGRCGQSKVIEDAASFMGSPWSHMVGNVDITVAPELIARARQQMDGPSRAHS